MKTLPIALLGLLVALGLALRLAQASPQKLGEDEGRWIRSRWLLDDPDTCYHLRAAELALRLPRAAERDPYLNHPGGAESPWLPMYDTLLSGFAGRFLSERGVDPAEGGVDEVEDHRSSEEWVEDLDEARPHARALSGGEDDSLHGWTRWRVITS